MDSATSVVPITLKVGEREHCAAWANLAGPASGVRLEEFADDKRDIVVGVDASRRFRGALRRAGWIDLGTLPVYARVLDAAQAMKQRFAAPWMHRLGSMLNLPLAAADFCLRRKLRDSRVTMRPVPRFDQRVEDLWREVAQQFPVIARRDRDELNRHYAHADDCRLYYFMRDGQLIGYAALRFSRDPSSRRASIVDYLCAPEWTYFVLGSCIDLAQRAGMVVIYCVHRSPHTERAFPQLGFVRRDSGRSLLFRARSVSSDTMARLCRGTQWFVTEGDQDVSRQVVGNEDRPTTLGPQFLGGRLEHPYTPAAFATHSDLTNSAGAFIRHTRG